MRHVRRTTASGIGNRRNARDLDACPTQQHGQGTCVVGVATQVCVEVKTHIVRMPADAAPWLAAPVSAGSDGPSPPGVPM